MKYNPEDFEGSGYCLKLKRPVSESVLKQAREMPFNMLCRGSRKENPTQQEIDEAALLDYERTISVQIQSEKWRGVEPNSETDEEAAERMLQYLR